MRGFHTLKKKKKNPGQLSSSMAFHSCYKKHSQKNIFGVLFSLNSDSFLKEDYTTSKPPKSLSL